MSDLVGNPEDRFSHNDAHITSVFIAHHYALCMHPNVAWAQNEMSRSMRKPVFGVSDQV